MLVHGALAGDGQDAVGFVKVPICILAAGAGSGIHRYPGDAAAIGRPQFFGPGGIAAGVIGGGLNAPQNRIGRYSAVLVGLGIAGSAAFEGDLGQIRTSVKDRPVHNLHTGGNGDLRQRHTTCKGVAPDHIQTLGQGHTGHDCAAFKGGGAQGGQALGQRQRLQGVAILKGGGADHRQRIGQRQVLQRCAALKGAHADGRHSSGDRQLRQARVAEGAYADLGQAAG